MVILPLLIQEVLACADHNPVHPIMDIECIAQADTVFFTTPTDDPEYQFCRASVAAVSEFDNPTVDGSIHYHLFWFSPPKNKSDCSCIKQGRPKTIQVGSHEALVEVASEIWQHLNAHHEHRSQFLLPT